MGGGSGEASFPFKSAQIHAATAANYFSNLIMESVQENVVVDDEIGIRSSGYSLVSDISSPTCELSSRSLLVRVEISNVKSVINETLLRKLVESIVDVECENKIQIPVGNCLKGYVVGVGERVEDFKGTIMNPMAFVR